MTENPTKEVQLSKKVVFEKGQLGQEVSDHVKWRNLNCREYRLWFGPYIDIYRGVLDVHGLIIKILGFFILFSIC